MSATSSENDEEAGHSVVKLLRQAQALQQEAQRLIARAEEVSRREQAVVRHLSGAGTAVWAGFTGRERGVAELLTQGLSNRMIARRLDISERTVKNHLNSIFHKLGVADRTQAVIVLMRGA
ncbi:LuxR C-terminal-related transcriptional regulator [Actinosynnema sp. NPDC023587]|uniref:response regulator transcription factor n=1 Tax=Actinosynnema sp. NPDC023587 TaxID=3154695 RepID=UPI003411AC60